ncbi:hypothetical protein GN109_16695 [Collimonas pratensis]|uniref:hypothetical protein n=1 Tax=Collimonas pratensis TaxID=279113 RepID=UPI00143CFED6|nr:hypothetical protein [Collimonas pratensis]NKI71066.1 hypothetical protein [Collimonas pratensis]
MTMHSPQADWNGSKITVTSSLLPKILWQTASIDVFFHDKCLLKTGGQLKLTGSHSTQFEHAGVNHEVTLTWGHAGLRSFPVEVDIDGKRVLKSRVFTRNWPLSFLPWVAAVTGFIVYSAFRQ